MRRDLRNWCHHIEIVFRAGLAHFSPHLHYLLYLMDCHRATRPIKPRCTLWEEEGNLGEEEGHLGGDADRRMVSAEPPDGRDAARPLSIAKAEMALGERLIWAETSSAASARRRVLPISLLGWLFLRRINNILQILLIKRIINYQRQIMQSCRHLPK